MADTIERPTGAAATRQRVLLVAEREFRERIRTKAFKIVLGITVLVVVGLTVIPTFFDSTTEYDLGVVGPAASAFVPAAERIAEADAATANVTTYPTVADAEAALRSGTVEAVYDSVNGEIIWEDDTATRTQAVVSQAAAAANVQQQASQLGIPPQDLQRLLAPPTLDNRTLVINDPDRNVKIATALAGAILLFVFLQMAGGFLLQGVIEEKSSRIVEVLVAQVRPYQLLAGKVLGIGALALVQLAVVVGTAYVAGTAAGLFPNASLAAGAVGAVLLWFVLGFAFYAVVFGAAGSLCNRMEDAQGVTFPITAPLLIGYLVAFALPENPDLALATWLSMFPPTAPVLMPMRMVMGVATPIEVAVAVVLTLAGSYGLVRLAGRVYAGAVLRSGARVKVRDALRSGAGVGGG